MSDSESVTHVNPDEFKIAVKEWVMINDQLADNRKFVSERNKRKKQLTQFIISFNLSFFWDGITNPSVYPLQAKPK